MEKNKVAVIGAGLMGNGIAQACATAGYDVVNIDTFEAAIEKSKATVEKLFSRKVTKGSMTEEKKAEPPSMRFRSSDIPCKEFP